MTFRLFIDSSTGIDVEPTWDYEDKTQKIEDRHRSRGAKEYVYKWSEYSVFSVPVTYVSSEFKSIVNSWWSSNTNLQWMEEGTSNVYNVRLVNDNVPIGKNIAPYTNQFEGVLELESYD